MNYPKINTLFKRDEHNIIIPKQFTLEEFEYLKNLKWECTEKIDGTNIHVDLIKIGLDTNPEMFIRGRTESAVIPNHLNNKLKELFNSDFLCEYFSKNKHDIPFNISIFGEGFGYKIQNGGNYIKDSVDFILFDINIDGIWLKRESLEQIAKDLNLKIVPLIGYMTIDEAIKYVDNGFKSTIAENKDYDAEGLVLKTPCGLKDRMGNKIITKIKTKDFRELKLKQKYDKNKH